MHKERKIRRDGYSDFEIKEKIKTFISTSIYCKFNTPFFF